MIKTRFKIALVFQTLITIGAVALDLPGSWGMFSSVERIHFSILKNGVPINHGQHIAEGFNFVTRKDTLHFLDFLCRKYESPLILKDHITQQEHRCEGR